ncbi:hypothetical protein DFH07DRAFT_894668 [Mycena maculata]|uniref:F-box domain-containing protein n=1 Tax=Mycena maculata TaxID=230809 RepID=A0AAD7HZ08_9AGAR|nr:hypothetical protein DFH07DRAFT_894668 [Mycena maculata]
MVLGPFCRCSSGALMKHILSRPLSWKHNTAAQCSPTQPLQHLPAEIFIEIAGFLELPELLRLSITSSHLRTLLLPAMYRSISLESSRACLSGLAMLSNHLGLCIYVRSLILRPNYPIACWPRPYGPVSETDLAQAVERLLPHLKNLQKFEWGGAQLPPDSLWVTLRTACPELRKVYSTAGSRLIDPDCELFKFENLTGFALSVLFCEEDLVQTGIPLQLWDMLLNRCPDLEELTLRLFYSSHNLREMDKLTSGIFPNLRSLHIEIWFYNRDPVFSQPSVELLGPFLSAHPSIRELSILPYTSNSDGRDPDTLPLFLAPAALPRLTSFVGVYQHLGELPNLEALETLDLTGNPIGGACIEVVARILNRLVSLRSLDIRLADPLLLRDVTFACSGLRKLRVMFGVKFGLKTLKDISLELNNLPHLRSFTLYKSHRLVDETMLRCALLILTDNPRLDEVQLAWFVWPQFGRRQNGSYLVMTDDQNRRYFDVWERGVRSPGMGGAVFDRRFRYPLETKINLRGSVSKALARVRR